jgi:hypothetical protein
MRQWLTRESVAAYFRLARQARAADAQRLREREKFWSSNFPSVDDAWLLTASGSRPGMAIERLARGRLGGCLPNQVAVLLKIRGLTVLESSHDQSEIVWLEGNPLAPRLFQNDQIYWLGSLASGADFSSGFVATTAVPGKSGSGTLSPWAPGPRDRCAYVPISSDLGPLRPPTT